MDRRWMLKTHGDPLGRVRTFLGDVWQQLGLDSLLVPNTDCGINQLELRRLDSPGQLHQVNPFQPLMTANTARHLPGLLNDYADARMGVLLRPCEMRALVEMAKHDSFRLDRLFTICIDCLGTLPLDEYQWRAARKGSPGALAQEALQFARQGGIVPYRYRSACQMCFSPEAKGGDVNLHVLGLPARQYLLFDVGSEAVAEQLGLNMKTPVAKESLVLSEWDKAVATLVERRIRARDRVSHSLAATLPDTTRDITEMLEGCGNCQECLQVCPICAVDFPERRAGGHYADHEVARWLMSCDGCGMCEEACPEHRPLSAIFGHMRELLTEPSGYVPGRSLEEPLPSN